MSTNDYFEQIGAWPLGSKKIALMYVLGFVSSLILTLLAYYLAVQQVFSQHALIVVLVLLALAQFGVQIVCFLHLDRRTSHDRLIALCAACLIIFILVSGSLWIMFTLNNRMMPSTAQMEQYMQDQSGF